MIYRYDPSADVIGDTDTEQDRVIFIKTIAEFMVCIKPFALMVQIKAYFGVWIIFMSIMIFKSSYNEYK